jgi:prepilin signal peptidase PulO-like enzyme (type II secretory pathway)
MPLLKPNVGRALSAIGALIVVLALFMTWYHVTRSNGVVEDTTGWQTFTNLRIVILAGGILTILSAIPPQTRPLLIARTLLGLVLFVLILRRIIDPPDLQDATVSSQIGVYAGLIGAILVALGGLVDTGRQVVQAYPGLWRPPAGELGRGQRAIEPGDDPR